MKIDSINNLRQCTSCQMCGAVCPKDAITIHLDIDGFYRPKINPDLCIDCGKCAQFCYKFDENVIITSSDELKRINLFSAYSNDRDLLNSTTSGGVAYFLSEELINQHYQVIGVVYDYETDRAVSRVAMSKDDIDSFKGSKYIQAYTIDAFKHLIQNCSNNKYAIFGLPCQIYAIDRYLNKINKRGQHILIDLYCHGCPSMLVWDKVIKKIRNKLGTEKFNAVNFRSKKNGWGQFVLEVSNGRKKYYSSALRNEFYDLFFSNQVLNESCTDCLLRSTLYYTDIRLGDFWGEKYRKNKQGISAVSIVTENGQKIFDAIKDKLTIAVEEPESFYPYQSWNHKYRINSSLRRDLLGKLQNSDSINDATRVLSKRMSSKQKIKRLLKFVYFKLNNILK